MAPKLEKAFTMRAYVDKEDAINTGAVKGGPHHVITPVTKGLIEGSGLKANLLPGGGDWLLLDTSKGVAHLDARLQARTDTGHSVHIYYRGIIKLDEKATRVFQYAPDAKTTEYGDHYLFSNPKLETSDENLKWVEESVFIGQGRFLVDNVGTGLEYEIYLVTN